MCVYVCFAAVRLMLMRWRRWYSSAVRRWLFVDSGGGLGYGEGSGRAELLQMPGRSGVAMQLTAVVRMGGGKSELLWVGRCHWAHPRY